VSSFNKKNLFELIELRLWKKFLPPVINICIMVFNLFFFTLVHVIYVQFIVCSENNCVNMHIFLGCWCNTSYLSMGFWWWSQSSTNAKRFAGCQMGWWCWIRVNCHCYRYLFISSSLHVCLNYFLRQYITFRNWLQVGGLFRDSKSWALKSLGRYKLTFLFFSDKVLLGNACNISVCTVVQFNF
jgi:hypothetical protein